VVMLSGRDRGSEPLQGVNSDPSCEECGRAFAPAPRPAILPSELPGAGLPATKGAINASEHRTVPPLWRDSSD
jgi:hypothetical protein